MYNSNALKIRKCRGIKKDGERCQGWAMWGHPGQLCGNHAGRHHRGPMPKVLTWEVKKAKYIPCECKAYNWPHRPGGGYCNWPDPPFYLCLIPPSTHSWPRVRSWGELFGGLFTNMVYFHAR